MHIFETAILKQYLWIFLNLKKILKVYYYPCIIIKRFTTFNYEISEKKNQLLSYSSISFISIQKWLWFIVNIYFFFEEIVTAKTNLKKHLTSKIVICLECSFKYLNRFCRWNQIIQKFRANDTDSRSFRYDFRMDMSSCQNRFENADFWGKCLIKKLKILLLLY